MKSLLIDVAAIADELLAELKPFADARGLRLVGRRPPVDIVFRTDPDLFRSILSDLLGNAIGSCRAGGLVELVLMREADGELIVVVDDESEGPVPVETARAIAATRAKAAAIGGRVDLEGEEGIGCRYTLRIPVSHK